MYSRNSFVVSHSELKLAFYYLWNVMQTSLLLSLFVLFQGRYKITADLKNKAKNRRVACVEAEVEIIS